MRQEDRASASAILGVCLHLTSIRSCTHSLVEPLEGALVHRLSRQRHFKALADTRNCHECFGQARDAEMTPGDGKF